MLTLFLTQAAAGSILAFLLVSPRAAGPAFFRYSAAQTAVLIALAIPLAPPGGQDTARRILFGASAALLIASAGFFHLRRARAGMALLGIAAASTLAGIIRDALFAASPGEAPAPLYVLSALTGGLVTGSTLAAMVLGHFYLNVPGLPIAYLVRLCLLLLSALAARALVLGAAVAACRGTLAPLASLLFTSSPQAPPEGSDPFVILFLLIHAVFGVAAPAAFAIMAWRSARISSTQSATGILYVTLIVVIMGEMAGTYLLTLTRLPL